MIAHSKLDNTDSLQRHTNLYILEKSQSRKFNPIGWFIRRYEIKFHLYVIISISQKLTYEDQTRIDILVQNNSMYEVCRILQAEKKYSTVIHLCELIFKSSTIGPNNLVKFKIIVAEIQRQMGDDSESRRTYSKLLGLVSFQNKEVDPYTIEMFYKSSGFRNPTVSVSKH